MERHESHGAFEQQAVPLWLHKEIRLSSIPTWIARALALKEAVSLASNARKADSRRRSGKLRALV